MTPRLLNLMIGGGIIVARHSGLPVLGFDLPGRALGLWWAIRDDVPAERP